MDGMMEAPARGAGVAERLSLLDERLRAIQQGVERDGARLLQGQARLAAAQARLAAAVAQQTTAHAVLSQWIKDWTAEVTAWRGGVDGRAERLAAEQERVRREVSQARGALRVAVWVLGAALTLVTGVLARALGDVVGAGFRPIP